MKKFASLVWEFVKIAVVSLAIILPIRYFLAEPFYVKGASMEPNFEDHQYLIVDRLDYRLTTPARGEVVVFRYPKDPQEYYIKRIIGLPGETVEVKNDKVYIYNQQHPEGWELPEEYLTNSVLTDPTNPLYTRVELQPDEYFVLGDNRGASQDSRFFGPVNKTFFIGRVIFRGWPFDKAGVLPSVQYQ